jgi:hypothetical protein
MVKIQIGQSLSGTGAGCGWREAEAGIFPNINAYLFSSRCVSVLNCNPALMIPDFLGEEAAKTIRRFLFSSLRL